MPAPLEKSLKKRAKAMEKSGKLSKKNEGAYIYGTLRKTGWKPKRELHSVPIRAKK